MPNPTKEEMQAIIENLQASAASHALLLQEAQAKTEALELQAKRRLRPMVIWRNSESVDGEAIATWHRGVLKDEDGEIREALSQKDAKGDLVGWQFSFFANASKQPNNKQAPDFLGGTFVPNASERRRA